MLDALRNRFGRLHVRLLIVNAIVLLVPVVGLEFARLFERELLRSLERDMQNQATLIRRFVEARRSDTFDQSIEDVLTISARNTRTRVRILSPKGYVLLDSHRNGPPEGEEVQQPSRYGYGSSMDAPSSASPVWKEVWERGEVQSALLGHRTAFTRIREREPSVFLFLADPIFVNGRVAGAVYVTRSTQPVMAELYRIRTGLQRVLGIALVFTLGITLWLAFSITRPLERLARVAVRIAAGEIDLPIPISGSGEVRELGHALGTMTERLRQRMRDTAAFAADVAHGFKSPLTSIRGAAELLREGAADDPKARQRFLANIELDSERLDRLVSRLLQLSRIEASDAAPSVLDLAELVRECAQRCATPDVGIDVTAPDTLTAFGRREDLATALANLLDNAIRFSPPKTPVALILDADSRTIRILVRDAGPGVPPETRPRLFERFFTTDVEHGTGLGLSIVKSVAEAHGGRAYYAAPTSDSASGASFVIELPSRTQ